MRMRFGVYGSNKSLVHRNEKIVSTNLLKTLFKFIRYSRNYDSTNNF